MLVIRYFEDKYILSFDSFIEKEEFLEYNLAMRSIRIYYSKKYQGFVLSFEQVGEILAWAERWKWEIEFLPTAESKYKQELYDIYSPEIKYFRSRKEIDYSKILNPKYELLDFQKESIDEMTTRNITFLCDSAGLGKNLQGSFMGHYWFHENLIDGLLIVVRNSLTYTWYSDFIEYGIVVKPEEVEILDSKKIVNAFFKYRNKKVLIVGNHLIEKMISSHTSAEILDIKESWDKTNLGLIIDEGQDFRDAKTKKTTAMINHSNQFSFKIDSTATPWNKFWQVYGQSAILDRSLFPMSQNQFKMDVAKQLGNKYDIYHVESYDPVKVKEVEDKLKPIMIKRLKKDLPEMKHKQVINHVKFLMEKDHFNLYNAISKKESLRVKKEHNGKIDIKNLEKFFPYTIQVIDNPLLLIGKIEDASVNKLLSKWKMDKDVRIQYIDELIEDKIENQGDKLIVFDIHPLTLDMLKERYKKYNPVCIHGSTDSKDRESERLRFNNDKTCKIALLSAYTSSAGGNWNTNCNTIVVLNQPNDSILYNQLIERCYRINNTRDAVVINLSFANSLDLIRYKRNISKNEFNENFNTKELDDEKINKLLNGVV